MTRRIKLSPKNANELAALRDADLQSLKFALDELDKLKTPILSLKQILSVFSKALTPDTAQPIVRQIVQFCTFQRNQNLDPEEILNELKDALKEHWTEEEVRKWEKRKHVLERIVRNKSISLSVKALDLSYDFQKLFISGRIVTDVRPVFDEVRDDIVGGITYHTLRIDYTSDDGRHTVSFALDNDDLLQLKSACDNALRKTHVANGLLTDSCHIQALDLGDETYDPT